MTTAGKNKWLYIVAGLIITANIVTLALLWIHGKNNGRDHHERQGGPQTFNYLSTELKFDEQQKKAYSLLRDEHRLAADDLEDSIRNAKDELFTLLQKPDASAADIQSKANTAATFSARIDTLTFYHFKKLRLICHPDQQKKFDEIINEAIRNMGGGPPGGPRGGHRPPPGGPPPPPGS